MPVGREVGRARRGGKEGRKGERKDKNENLPLLGSESGVARVFQSLLASLKHKNGN